MSDILGQGVRRAGVNHKEWSIDLWSNDAMTSVIRYLKLWDPLVFWSNADSFDCLALVRFCFLCCESSLSHKLIYHQQQHWPLTKDLRSSLFRQCYHASCLQLLLWFHFVVSLLPRTSVVAAICNFCFLPQIIKHEESAQKKMSTRTRQIRTKRTLFNVQTNIILGRIKSTSVSGQTALTCALFGTAINACLTDAILVR